jgi:imidazole glycerol-phosphate synthase subunit HisH
LDIAIIKYNAGNIQSVLFALERLGISARVTDDPDLIHQADRVIFPGVGEARTAMHYLKERKLDELIKGLKQPILGICLGMQLMCQHSEENNTTCLGIFGVQVKKFQARGPGLKVPQVGWNRIFQFSGSLFEGLAPEPYCYFVHSYYAELGPETIALADYGIRFSSGLRQSNFYGVQFHPEKSAGPGEKILNNFLSNT